MAENVYNQFIFPYSQSSRGIEQGPYYWRPGGAGLGEDVNNNKAYYWMEKWIQDQYGLWPTKRRIIYWAGVKVVDREYDPDEESSVEDTTRGLPASNGYMKLTRNSWPYMELLDVDPDSSYGDEQYFEVFREDVGGFERIYNYYNPVRAPKTLGAPPPGTQPYDARIPGEADYYLFGWRLNPVNTASEFDDTSKDATPWAMNCDVGVRFAYTYISRGLYQVMDAQVYLDIRYLNSTTSTDCSYVHNADKSFCQRVRHRYTSNGKYYIRTDDYYENTGQILGGADLYYSDVRWTVEDLGGAQLFDFNGAAPTRISFAGFFKAGIGDYIIDKNRRDKWYKISDMEVYHSEHGIPVNGYVLLDQIHHFTDSTSTTFQDGVELYYSPRRKPNPFRIDWDYPPTVSNMITNYESYAVYPKTGFRNYEMEIPFSYPSPEYNVGVIPATAGLHGKIGPIQRETLTLDMKRKTPTTTYTQNVGHLNNGFCVVPFDERAFGFDIEILNEPSTHVINIVRDNNWYSNTVELANCELIGDPADIHSNFIVMPIKANEHFECKLKYRFRQTPGGSYINLFFIVKGFYLPPGNLQTLALETDMAGALSGDYLDSLDPFDIAGDQSLGITLELSDLYPETTKMTGESQKVVVRESQNCIVFDDKTEWNTLIPLDRTLGTLFKCNPVTVMPTGDPWSVHLQFYLAHQGIHVRIPESRYYGDHGLQVWNDKGETRLNTSSRHPRIIYTFAGNVDYPVGVTVPEFMGRFDNIPFVEERAAHTIDSQSTSDFNNIDYANPKYGVASYRVDRDQAKHFKVAASDDFNFGSGAFTIEFWFYPYDASGYVFDHRQSGSTSGMLLYYNNGIFRLWYGGDFKISVTGQNAPTLNEWNHIALARSNNVIRLFVNGILVGTWTTTTSFVGNGFTVGARYTDNNRGNFNIDELRIVKGQAMYVYNFTPPNSMHLGENQAIITDTEVPELAELVNDGTWHINLNSDRGLTEVSFDYGGNNIILSKTLPKTGNIFYSSTQDFVRFQVMRI